MGGKGPVPAARPPRGLEVTHCTPPASLGAEVRRVEGGAKDQGHEAAGNERGAPHSGHLTPAGVE